jgi:cytochrome c oxidase cbb3-type subunit 3
VNKSRQLLLTMVGLLLVCGCESTHGKPGEDSEILAPDQIVNFATLYSENCAGCHGTDGRGGAAIAIANPIYLAVADKGAIRKVTANGVQGTSMPAFARSAGGMLTDKQIDAIVDGIVSRWSQPGLPETSNLPAYSAKSRGRSVHGELVFQTYCESCHGPLGRGGPKASAITNDSFLSLVSDQGLRTLVVVGRPELGAPDFRGNVVGKPMSEQEITDVVAWLVSRRAPNLQPPNSTSNETQHQEPNHVR